MKKKKTPRFPRRPSRRAFFLPVFHLPVILFTACSFFFPGCQSGGPELQIMTWNVENLFDDVNNGTEYSDYVPGENTWTAEDFHGKMASLAEAIRAAVPGGPDILLLQEVENLNALTRLNESYLKGLGYRHAFLERSPGQAVGLGILSRHPLAEMYTHTYYHPDSPVNRAILECWVETPEETVIIFNNHWKSKIGGAKETEPLRREAAGIIARRTGELRRSGVRHPVLLAGDFNEDIFEFRNNHRAWSCALMNIEDLPAESPEMSSGQSLVYSFSPEDVRWETPVFFSPWPAEEDLGSYYYNGRWEKIDHFFLSRDFFEGSGWYYHDFRVNREEFLLTAGGFPKKWDRNFGTGYSDHLALVLTLRTE